MTAAEMKTCARCKLDLPRDRFTGDPRMQSGLKSYCKDCCRVDARVRYRTNPRVREVANAWRRRTYTPERGRRQHLKAMYGLTVAAYEQMLREQRGACAICRTQEPGGKGDWHVDHCHDTKKVRGLLCSACNVGIGYLKDDPARLRAAADYIERASA